MKKSILPLLCVFAALMLLLSACGNSGKTAKTTDLSGVMTNMKEKITNTELMDLTPDDLMPNYGIDSADVKQFAACADSTGTKGDEIVLIEGRNDEAASRIQEKLEARYKQKSVEMKDYLPEEFAVLKKCRVVRKGLFVSMIVSPQQEELEKIYEESFA